jgi:hypothetical protein
LRQKRQRGETLEELRTAVSRRIGVLSLVRAIALRRRSIIRMRSRLHERRGYDGKRSRSDPEN